MAQDFDQRDFETHHDQLIDPPDSAPVTVDAELLPETCQPPVTEGFAGANFPVSQSEFERLTGKKRQTFGNHIRAIDTHLGCLGSCLDDQKRITADGAQWLQGYWDAPDKPQYLDALLGELQSQALDSGNTLPQVSAATSEHSALITQRESQLTEWVQRSQSAALEAQEAFLQLCEGEQKDAEFAAMESDALEAELMAEVIAELAAERRDRQTRKAELKTHLRARLAAAKQQRAEAPLSA